MVKYGKDFRKNQKIEWKEKYFDYKAHKKLIKQYIKENEKNALMDELTPSAGLEKLSEEFVGKLDKEIKKVYIFFANKEKTLYKKINQYLHLKNQYPDFELSDYVEQYNLLKDLSQLSLDMSNYVYYNLKALLKILKKFDNKVLTSKNKDLFIRINYIQTRIEEQNSDILYLLNFKMIDEVNVILEDLINSLMQQFKLNKDTLEEETNEDNKENKLIEGVQNLDEASTLIKQNHEQIKKNIQEIDKISDKVNRLFVPWKSFLRISSDANSRYIQIQRESAINDSMSSGRVRMKTIINSISFSRQSKYNIAIILIHGFLYMFSFSVIIPSYTSFIENFDKDQTTQTLYWGILMIMAPLGTLINYLYETFLFKRSTKKPIILSCVGLIVGNLLYVYSPHSKIYLLFLGRLICGLFNLRTHNKMYIINFLLQKDVSFYLTMFHTTSILGLGIGFASNAGFLFIKSEKSIINKSTMGPIIAIIISFILLIFTIAMFTEAHSKSFSITRMNMFGDGIINPSENVAINSDEEDVAKDVKRKTTILKDIDTRLGSVNMQSNFDDTNLVSRSINELASKEEGGLHSLFKVFIVYFLIIFTTKFINESMYINSHIFMNQITFNNTTEIPWLISVVLGCSCLMILLVELSLSKKSSFISERSLIIILLSLLLINNGLFILFYFLEINLIFNIATDIILASISEKYTAHLFLYIIPDSYIICKIHGNVFISIFSMISRILCSGLLIIVNMNNTKVYNLTIYIVMTSLSFFSLLLYLIFYKEIRIKAIKRIMKNIPKDDIKVATEL